MSNETQLGESPLRAKGRAMRRKLVGDAYADNLLLGYVGAPLVREAHIAAKEVFAEMRAEDAKQP